MSTTMSYFTLSVVRLLVECTRRQRKGDSKNHSDSCRPAWLDMDRKVCLQLLLLKQKEVELLLLLLLCNFFFSGSPFSLYLGVEKPPERKSKARKVQKSSSSKESKVNVIHSMIYFQLYARVLLKSSHHFYQQIKPE